MRVSKVLRPTGICYIDIIIIKGNATLATSSQCIKQIFYRSFYCIRIHIYGMAIKINTRSKIIVITFLKICLTAIFTLLMIEGSIRAYHRINPVYFLPNKDKEANLANKFRGKPYADVYGYKLNSKGFKDKEYSLEKQSGTVRILGIGDSFVYGTVPYPDNFLTILESKLRKVDSQIEVINMGISGSDPAGYLSLLEEEGLDYNPDIVMVFFYIGNDFFMYGPDNVFETDKKKGKAQKKKRRWPIVSASYLYKTMEFASTLVRNYNSVEVLSNRYNDAGSTMDSEFYFLTLSNNADKYMVNTNGLFEMLTSDLWQREFLFAIQDITAISDLCKKKGIELIFVMIPEEMQVDQKYQSIVKQYRGYPDYSFDYSIPNKLLAIQLEPQGIHSLDMLAPFRNDFSSRKIRLFRRNDGHWNIEGNKLAAEILFEYLTHNSPALRREDKAQ